MFKKKSEVNSLDEIKSTIFSKNLALLLEEKNLTQVALARKTGLFPQNINKYLKGHSFPSLEISDRIAKALDVRVDKLVCEQIINDNCPLINNEELYSYFDKTFQEFQRKYIFNDLNDEQIKLLKDLSLQLGGWPVVINILKNYAKVEN